MEEEGGKEAEIVEEGPPGERNGWTVEVGGKELGVDRMHFPSDMNEAEGQSGPQVEMKSTAHEEGTGSALSGRSRSRARLTGGPPVQSALYQDLGWVRGEGDEDSGKRHATNMAKSG